MNKFIYPFEIFLFIVILFLFTNTYSQSVVKDTVYIKEIGSNQHNLYELFPYLIGLLGLYSSFYTLNKTLKHQKDIAQLQLLINEKKEWLKELREDYSNFFTLLSQIQLYIGKQERHNQPLSIFEKAYLDFEKVLHKLNLSLTHDNEKEMIGEIYDLNSFILKPFDIINNLKKEMDDNIKLELKSSLKDTNDKLTKMEGHLQVKFLKLFDRHMDEINKLLKEKQTSKFIEWIKKSYKEVGEYKG